MIANGNAVYLHWQHTGFELWGTRVAAGSYFDILMVSCHEPPHQDKQVSCEAAAAVSVIILSVAQGVCLSC